MSPDRSGGLAIDWLRIAAGALVGGLAGLVLGQVLVGRTGADIIPSTWSDLVGPDSASSMVGVGLYGGTVVARMLASRKGRVSMWSGGMDAVLRSRRLPADAFEASLASEVAQERSRFGLVDVVGTAVWLGGFLLWLPVPSADNALSVVAPVAFVIALVAVVSMHLRRWRAARAYASAHPVLRAG